MIVILMHQIFLSNVQGVLPKYEFQEFPGSATPATARKSLFSAVL